MEKYEIIKSYKKKDKETGEVIEVKTTYNTDPKFKPSKPEQICEEFIINYCKDDDEKAEWLFKQYEEIVKDKNGKAVKKSFLQIRKEFIELYFADIVVSSKKSSAKEEFIKMMKAKKK